MLQKLKEEVNSSSGVFSGENDMPSWLKLRSSIGVRDANNIVILVKNRATLVIYAHGVQRDVMLLVMTCGECEKKSVRDIAACTRRWKEEDAKNEHGNNQISLQQAGK